MNMISMVIYETSFAQSVFNNIINAPIFMENYLVKTASTDQDLDFHTDSSGLNELGINENITQ